MSDILNEMEKQAQGMGRDNFICQHCINYSGNLICKANVFIAFTGANMSLCRFYRDGCKKCHDKFFTRYEVK